MSWIYGASGGTNFWEEQIKNEKRLKKNWADTYGVEVTTKRAAELEEMAELEKEEAAKADRTAKLTARPKLQKVPSTWKMKCGPTGESSYRVGSTCCRRLSLKPPPLSPHPNRVLFSSHTVLLS